MTTEEVAQAAEAWAVSVITGLNSYEHAPRNLLQAMPLVLAEVQRKSHQQLDVSEGAFQQHKFQQTSINVWEIDLLFLVNPADSWTASQTLYNMTDTLGLALNADPTLGQRVSFASEDYEVRFDPPEFEYADGTIARAATMTITVGEQRGV
jgi:hypothetical protein